MEIKVYQWWMIHFTLAMCLGINTPFVMGHSKTTQIRGAFSLVLHPQLSFPKPLHYSHDTSYGISKYCLVGHPTTMEFHITHHVASTSCYEKKIQFSNISKFPNFSKNAYFKNFCQGCHETMYLASHGQFWPYASQFDLYTRNSTLPCRISDEFHCRNWGFFPISPWIAWKSQIQPTTCQKTLVQRLNLGIFNP